MAHDIAEDLPALGVDTTANKARRAPVADACQVAQERMDGRRPRSDGPVDDPVEQEHLGLFGEAFGAHGRNERRIEAGSWVDHGDAGSWIRQEVILVGY